MVEDPHINAPFYLRKGLSVSATTIEPGLQPD